jgi:2-polyprenyl-3-methyl-5-hydroxy-6-metoxy-1,4-benzoquinol methylase
MSEPIKPTIVDSYGWKSATPPHTHAYLCDAILAACRRANARRVLDVGCGNGALCRALSAAGFEVVGCDSDPEGIEIAAQADPAARFQALGVYDDPAELGEADFDAVISTEVVEHLFAPRALPRFARAVLRNGGSLILSTPYHGFLKNLALSLADKWDFHHSPLWDGGHIKFWSRKTLARLLVEEGFEVAAFQGIGRVPLLWKTMIMVGVKQP